jgi:TPR repeat protein
MQVTRYLFAVITALVLSTAQALWADVITNSRPTAQVQDKLTGAKQAAPAKLPDNTVEKAMAALYTARDKLSYQNAVNAMQNLAVGGNTTAALRLGRFFHLETRSPDYARALQLYSMAMDRGDGWATNNIGLLYENGKGVAADINKARALYQLATERGDYHGFNNLARLYFTGTGVTKDPTAAQAWLDKGIKKGFKEVCEEATSIYYYGRYGVAVDYSKALYYEEATSRLGDRDAAWRAAKMYLDGVGTAQNTAKAIEMLERLASLNEAAAINTLGTVYANGKGVQMDKRKAVEYFEKAAALHNCMALRNLGDAYDNGWGASIDHAKATEFMVSAANCGTPPEGFDVWKLATRYRNGIGIAQDCSLAEKLLTESITLGYTDAITSLGFLHQHGCDPIKPDLALAFKIYLSGAKYGIPLCQNNVGAMLKHGYGVDSPDRIKAFAWLTLAAQNGSDIAKENLQDFSNMFTAEDREKGLLHMQTIQKLIIKPGQTTPSSSTDAY